MLTEKVQLDDFVTKIGTEYGYSGLSERIAAKDCEDHKALRAALLEELGSLSPELVNARAIHQMLRRLTRLFPVNEVCPFTQEQINFEHLDNYLSLTTGYTFTIMPEFRTSLLSAAENWICPCTRQPFSPHDTYYIETKLGIEKPAVSARRVIIFDTPEGTIFMPEDGNPRLFHENSLSVIYPNVANNREYVDGMFMRAASSLDLRYATTSEIPVVFDLPDEQLPPVSFLRGSQPAAMSPMEEVEQMMAALTNLGNLADMLSRPQPHPQAAPAPAAVPGVVLPGVQQAQRQQQAPEPLLREEAQPAAPRRPWHSRWSSTVNPAARNERNQQNGANPGTQRPQWRRDCGIQ